MLILQHRLINSEGTRNIDIKAVRTILWGGLKQASEEAYSSSG